MSSTPPEESVVRSYLQALEARAPVDAIRALLAEDAFVEVLPNALDPHGSRRTRAEALADVERGRALMREERYEILSVLAGDGRVAVEVAWRGVLAVAVGGRPAGAPLQARCSMHFEVRDGRIVAQRNYDCFEAFGGGSTGA